MIKKDTENEMKFALVQGKLYTPSGIGVSDLTDFDYYTSGYKWVTWGFENRLPQVFYDNYLKCSLLTSIVNRMCDYTYGEGLTMSETVATTDNEEDLESVVRKCVFDYILFGGFAVECIRNRMGDIVRYNYVNVMNLRVNADLTTAYISRKWTNYSSAKVIEVPLYNKNENQSHFIFYYRGTITKGVNPIPCYISALKSIEILNNTRNFHKRNLENGFNISCIINLNDGNVKTKELAEIKEKLEKGYTGSENAGKILILNNQDKAHAATVERLSADNFGELYLSLSQSSETDIMTAFGINEMLLGRNVQTGFSKEEFENAYALFYTTTILPIQQTFQKQFKKINLGFEFKPFKIEWGE